jgi:hypothetical protein
MMAARGWRIRIQNVDAAQRAAVSGRAPTPARHFAAMRPIPLGKNDSVTTARQAISLA